MVFYQVILDEIVGIAPKRKDIYEFSEKILSWFKYLFLIAYDYLIWIKILSLKFIIILNPRT